MSEDARSAIEAVASAAKLHGFGAKPFAESVSDVGSEVQFYHRALHVIERRELELRVESGRHAKDTIVRPLPQPESLDPWAVDPARVESESRVLSACPKYSGDETISCGQCNGTTRVRCGDCGGSGRVHGQRGMKNCPRCRAGGSVKCTNCRSGKVACAPCNASGRVYAWLALKTTQLQQVLVHPMNVGASVHVRAGDPMDFEHGPWPNELMNDSGLQSASAELILELRPRLDARTDRVLRNRVQTFRATTWQVRYRTAFRSGVAFAGGQPMTVSPSSDWAPLDLRRRLIQWAAVIWVGCALVGALAYRVQHPWYGVGGFALPMAGFGVAMSACLTVALEQATRVEEARRRSLGVLWICLAVGSWIGVAGAMLVGRPSAGEVRAALSSGDLELAELTASALAALGGTKGELPTLSDEIRLAHIKLAKTPSSAVASLAEPWSNAARRAEAEAIVVGQLEEEAMSALSRSDLRRLNELARIAENTPAAQPVQLARQIAVAGETMTEHRLNETAAALSEALRLGAPATAVDPLRKKAIEVATADLRSALVDTMHRRTRKDGLSRAVDASKAITALTGAPSDPPLEAISHWGEKHRSKKDPNKEGNVVSDEQIPSPPSVPVEAPKGRAEGILNPY